MNERELRTLLIKATEDRPPGLNLMPASPRRRRPARILVPLASIAAAAALGVALVVGPGSQASALAQVSAAVEHFNEHTYRFHTTSGARAFEGAFDPAGRVGIIKALTEGSETRFVGDLMYSKTQGEDTWYAEPRPEAGLAKASAEIALVKGAVLNPEAALRRLRSATDVHESGTASGQGWTGTRFAFTLDSEDGNDPRGKAYTSPKLTGTVDVDDQEQVRRLEINFADENHKLVTEFSDFGTPVSVTAPPADQVQQRPAEDPDVKPTGKTDHRPSVKTS